jgi:drug/metabolite transporter (DMT)-like permease
MNDNLKAHISLFSAQVIYALNYSIAKDLMPHDGWAGYIGPGALVLLRIAGACLLFWTVSFFSPSEKLEKSHWIKFLLLAIFGVACNQLCFIFGLSLTHPINSAIIMTSNPIVVTLFTLFVMKERITIFKVSGILLGISGALILMLANGKGFSVDRTTMAGDALTLINSCSWAAFIVMAKPYMQRYQTVTVMKWIFLFGIFLVMPFGAEDFLQTQFSSFSFYAWFALLFVIVATTFLAYFLNTYALKALSASTVSAYIYVQPFLATAFALLFGKDHLTFTKVLAGALVIAGVYLAGKKQKKTTI